MYFIRWAGPSGKNCEFCFVSVTFYLETCFSLVQRCKNRTSGLLYLSLLEKPHLEYQKREIYIPVLSMVGCIASSLIAQREWDIH